jgi:hypothetical protein
VDDCIGWKQRLAEQQDAEDRRDEKRQHKTASALKGGEAACIRGPLVGFR